MRPSRSTQTIGLVDTSASAPGPKAASRHSAPRFVQTWGHSWRGWDGVSENEDVLSRLSVVYDLGAKVADQ